MRLCVTRRLIPDDMFSVRFLRWPPDHDRTFVYIHVNHVFLTCSQSDITNSVIYMRTSKLAGRIMYATYVNLPVYVCMYMCRYRNCPLCW